MLKSRRVRSFDYKARADLFPARSRNGQRPERLTQFGQLCRPVAYAYQRSRQRQKRPRPDSRRDF